jgi:ammonium transporter, Amt family
MMMALAASPAFAQAAAQPAKIDAADTAWMISATGLVLMMSIPGLALFYSGMVRKKNVLATMAQTLAAVAFGSILWMAIGYSLAFTGNSPAIGTFDRALLLGMEMNAISPLAKTIPESVFMLYQMTFAVITVALVAGSVADRMRFSISGSLPAGCCWSMCRSHIGCGAAASSAPRACWISPAAWSCI